MFDSAVVIIARARKIPVSIQQCIDPAEAVWPDAWRALTTDCAAGIRGPAGTLATSHSRSGTSKGFSGGDP